MPSRLLFALSLLITLAGCAPAPPPAGPPPAAPPPSPPPPAAASVPRAATSPPPGPQAPAEPAPLSATRLLVCTELLAACKACEPQLAPEVAAGNRISCASQDAKFAYFLTTGEAPGVPQACRSQLDELRARCH